MAITATWGFDGSVNEAQWATTIADVGAEYGVAGATHFAVTGVAGADRTVSIAPGRAFNHGVEAVNDAAITKQQTTPVASGSRWDLLVARYNWSGTGGAVTIEFITGTAVRAIPAGRLTTFGTGSDDQPLALVQFTLNQQAPTAIVDLRCWAGTGGLVAASFDALSYLGAKIGTRAVLTDRDAEYIRVIDAQGNPTWKRHNFTGVDVGSRGQAIVGGSPGTGPYVVGSGSFVGTSDSFGYCRLVWPTAFPSGGVQTVILHNGDDGAVPDGNFPLAGSSGNFTSSGGYGRKEDVVYRVWGTVNGQRQVFPNRTHRVNWLALGW